MHCIAMKQIPNNKKTIPSSKKKIIKIVVNMNISGSSTVKYLRDPIIMWNECERYFIVSIFGQLYWK